MGRRLAPRASVLWACRSSTVQAFLFALSLNWSDALSVGAAQSFCGWLRASALGGLQCSAPIEKHTCSVAPYKVSSTYSAQGDLHRAACSCDGWVYFVVHSRTCGSARVVFSVECCTMQTSIIRGSPYRWHILLEWYNIMRLATVLRSS